MPGAKQQDCDCVISTTQEFIDLSTVCPTPSSRVKLVERRRESADNRQFSLFLSKNELSLDLLREVLKD
ncbi:hypothetical protein RRG08_016001 [Elysia crispata]|uniref:Uncharacterized protein n=1 Tax=Elysia crispata TaxID=231223 RepID=A0AAE1CPY1_9GAST|nr:hypothetical protein RRG08_016001 [Elysia crispata]